MVHRARLLTVGTIQVCLLAGALGTTACRGGERGKVLKTTPVEAGAGTVETERRRLQGTWELVSLETMDAAGVATRVEAAGRMTFDDYGNVKTTGTAKTGSSAASTLLSYSGRVVIDPDKKEWRLLDIAPEPGASNAPSAVAGDKIRSYEIVDDQLKLSLRDAAGKVTARVTWRRTNPV